MINLLTWPHFKFICVVSVPSVHSTFRSHFTVWCQWKHFIWGKCLFSAAHVTPTPRIPVFVLNFVDIGISCLNNFPKMKCSKYGMNDQFAHLSWLKLSSAASANIEKPELTLHACSFMHGHRVCGILVTSDYLCTYLSFAVPGFCDLSPHTVLCQYWYNF